MNVHIYYHNDLDGYISANIVKTKVKNCILHQCKYPNVIFNFSDTFDDDVIYILDFCFDDKSMIKLNKYYRDNVIWIDHHKSSIDRSKKFGFYNLIGDRGIGFSACELTLQWFNLRDSQFVKNVGQFDTFRNSNNRQYFHENILPFYFGCNFYIQKLKPQNYNVKLNLINNQQFLNKINKIGKIIYKNKYNQFCEQCKNNSYVKKIWGYNVLCMNCSDKGSMVFQIPNYFDQKKHDMMLIYNYDGTKWNYGFYSPITKTNVDCSQIAKMYGGGGHKGASGCSTNELIQQLL